MAFVRAARVIALAIARGKDNDISKTRRMRMYPAKPESRIEELEISRMKREASDLKMKKEIEKNKNNELESNGLCPKCRSYCFGDC